MFHSAVLRLTGWYLLILMSISILFSVTIYQVATTEISDRLTAFQSQFEQPIFSFFSKPGDQQFLAYRNDQRAVSDRNIMITLIYVNLLILCGGGALSYLLARRTLRQLEELHESQARFTSDASHELRTPLAAMKSELEVAINDPKLSKADMRDLLKSNLEEVDKLTSLSQTLLQLSKMDYTSLELGPIDLNTVVEEVVQRYDKNASRIVLHTPIEPIVVKGNQTSIEELVTILVDNALKYSAKSTKITARLSIHGRNAAFAITNKGQGIAVEDLPHVFDRFYRVNEARNDGGAGLGLALAKEIVALHKGELSVSSARGKDTTFTFILPLAKR